jgi:hypothetical protein
MDESSLVRSPKTRAGVGIAILWPNTNRSPSARIGIDLGLKEGMTLSTGATPGCSPRTRTHSLAPNGPVRSGARRPSTPRSRTAERPSCTRKQRRFDCFGLICVGNATCCGIRRLRATFVDTSEHLSTQTCCECGCVGGPKGLKDLEIREWTCDECAAAHDRDVNAARNILRLDVRRLQKEAPSTPPGWMERTSRAALAKQEVHVLMHINSEPEQDYNARDHELPASAGLTRQNAAHPIPEATHCNFLQAPLRGSRHLGAQRGCIDRLLVLGIFLSWGQHVNPEAISDHDSAARYS